LITILFVLFSTIALVTFIAVRGSVPQSETIEGLESLLQTVDVAAFLNLTSNEETAFLHSRLSPRSFRRLHRLRTWVTFKYLRLLSWNAAVVMRIGELASRSTDPSIAQSGRDLANAALRTRLLTLRAFLKLIPQLILPSYDRAANPQLVADYTELKVRFGLLASLQQPLVASRSVSRM
jgi:hypothetical protein